MTLAMFSMELLWRNALGAIPLAFAVYLICRFVRCRPSTRHAMWLIVLLSLLAPPLIPAVDVSNVVASWTADAKRPEPPVASDNAASTPLPRISTPATTPSSRTERRIDPLEFAPAAVNPPVDECADIQTESNDAALILAECEPVSVSADCEQADSAPAPAQSTPSVVVLDIPSFLLADGTAIRAEPVPLSNDTIAPPAHASLSPSPDSSAVPPLVESSTPAPASIEWRQWLAGVFAVRDAIARLTPIPTIYWLIGSVLILLVLAIRTIRFHGVLRKASPASGSVRREVQWASNSIGLRTPPKTLMSNDRISPMIWCGWERVLLLPRQLWADLDDTGRRAVLLHELAHLKRRDHWVRWTELLIGCLYWWHPLVWFVRGRLRDEADFCCDAWVTSLMPGGRTGYAKALVATRQFVSMTPNAVPAVGLGMTTNRTKRLARRLTMVMTQHSTPRLSIVGAGSVLCLAAAAWLAAPLWACPPEESEAQEKIALELAKVRATAPRVSVGSGVRVAAPHAVVVSPGDASTFERHMAERELEAARGMLPRRAPEAQWRMLHGELATTEGGDLDERLNRLEERLNRLTEHLERLMSSPQGQGSAPTPSAPRMRTPRPGQPSRLAPPAAPAPPDAPAPPGAPSMFYAPSGGAIAFGPSTGGGEMGFAYALAADGDSVVRIYRLPEGKREALYELMAREDVPVMVSSVPDGISVQATPRQHEAFQGFIILIHPEANVSESSGAVRLRLGELLERERSGIDSHTQALAARELQSMRYRLAAQPQQMEQMRRSMTQQQAEMHRQIQELHRRAEELSRKARDLETKSQHFESQADEAEDDASKEHLISQAIAMAMEAEAFESQAEWNVEHADAIAEMIDAMEVHIAEAIAAAEEALAEVELGELEADLEDEADCDDADDGEDDDNDEDDNEDDEDEDDVPVVDVDV